MLYFKMKVKKKKRGEEIEEEIMPKSKKKKKIINLMYSVSFSGQVLVSKS